MCFCFLVTPSLSMKQLSQSFFVLLLVLKACNCGQKMIIETSGEDFIDNYFLLTNWSLVVQRLASRFNEITLPNGGWTGWK